MKVQNYAVDMNAQYFNLQMQSIEAEISSTTQDFTDESSTMSKIQTDQVAMDAIHNELSKELSSAILKNVYSMSEKSVGDRVEISTNYTEAQSLNYQVKAFVQADGKDIELSLDVSLSRSFVQKTTFIYDTSIDLADPLVISLNGTMPSLTSNTFSFDIDSDGDSDQISALSSGNVFLALDKNDNGKIDNGSELFGSKSGDGFADLKKYDDDKNGWIDENDKIFDKLRVWQKTNKDDKLIAMGEVGIGAIFLGNTQTPFSLKSQTNELLGQIRKSSFVLFEDGKAGVISQVDLAITEETKKSINTLEKLQKSISTNNVNETYSQNNNTDTSKDTSNSVISKIRARISQLEASLPHVPQDQRSSIRAQISGLNSQIIALLEVGVN